jgi:cobalamin biosynthesis protein CobT
MHCVPHFGPKALLACEWCLQRKSRCSHVGPVVTSTLTTDIAAWTAAVRDGAERVASAMDRQTDLFGMFINKMRGMREAVDHLSMSTASLSWVAASTVADEEEDEEAVGKEVGEDTEEEQEEDVAVDVTMGEVGDESGGDEEENEGGEGDNNDDKDEEGGEEGRLGTGGAEQDTVPKVSASVQVADQPRVPQVVERLHVPHPQWRVWKDKGKGKM